MKLLTLIFSLFLFASCSNTGKTIEKFSFNTIEGKTIHSEDLKGKIVVINIWATWCGMCIKEIPELNRLKEKYKNDSDVVFIAFSDEDLEKVKATLLRFPFNYTQIVNAENYTSKLKTRLVKTYPQNLILDKNQKVVFDITEAKGDIFSILDAEIIKLKN
jgi:cytochrome c biogenesis protein CcmG/thiol:disulfide interchange protein DsbE